MTMKGKLIRLALVCVLCIALATGIALVVQHFQQP